MKTSNEIRTTFLEFFRERGHEIVPSSPLVPANDPTLLFTNAGMVQFKDVFLGADKRPYVRATTSQRCVRAGGKHNDLENVGYTARHHTFFEMLGNFSFGDYFKQDAIRYCWELLTEVYGLPPEKLWVTVYEEDEEAEAIWKNEIGVDPERFSRCGLKDNFWSMGDTGPCGPCSEVFYDHGPEVPGGPPGSPDEDGDRYIEIWNLVFMQFNRAADGSMTPLPKPSVDTGMGLERLAAVLQGVHSNYEIDLFESLIRDAAEITKTKQLDDKSLRVIADHIRSCAFLVVDGVVPSNEGRGYVLRRIIRRAIRHGHRLGVGEPFFYRLVESLEREMADAYPELRERRPVVERILRQEEERFAETLDQGMRILEQSIDELSGTEIPGDTVFRLYDTYGFPVDLTADIARERGLSVDMAAFDEAMNAQRERARAASQFEATADRGLVLDCASAFTGYESLRGTGEVLSLFCEGEPVETLGPEDRGMVVLDSTPFYTEGGGQVGDRGELTANGARFEVEDTQRRGNAAVHVGVMTDGEIRVGDRLTATVDARWRRDTARNHSATHLLHAALRKVLGTHVTQKGSLVTPDRLRFDFSHFEPLGRAQLVEIETLVNDWILQNDEAVTRVMPLDDARQSGAIALFGEKYDDPVRVLSFGDYSTELCGGTHVRRTGDVGLFKLTSESGVAAGVRRVEAVTGRGAVKWAQAAEETLHSVAGLLKADRESLIEKAGQLQARQRELEKDLERLKARMAASHGDDLAAQAQDIDGLKVLAAKLDAVDPKRLRETVDQLKNKLGSAAVVLATVQGDKVSLVAGVTPDFVDRIEAGPLANFVAQQVGGRGGGRPDMAQAGGNDPSKIDQAIKSVPNWIKERLSS
ncbi:MAG: alanine--tRNA ligase [Gammaproteobacteria bacterium]|nr:alanine--tRNA ligase [Gammaproteobacteria bacterium]